MMSPAGPQVVDFTALPNGIKIISETMPTVRSAALGFWINAGSRNETASENGITHFIEHMLFKGTESRSAEEIAREADSIGGHLDAFTGKDMVGYNTKVLGEHLDRAFEILADLVLHPLFRDEDIEKEKGVVLEELKMETDNPESLIHEMFMSRHYHRHPLGRPILGTRRTIANFQPELLRMHHRKFYSPANLIVTAAGNLRHDHVVRLVENQFGHLPSGEIVGAGEPPRAAAVTYLRNKRSLHQVQLCIGSPCYAAPHPKRFAGYLLNLILGGGMSSRLFQDVRERQGLVYSVFSELNLFQDTGCITIYAGTSAETLNAVIDSVSRAVRDLKDNLTPEEELRRAKDHLKGSTILGLEASHQRMASLARQYLTHGRFYSIDELMDLVEQVTAQQVREAAQEFFQPAQTGVAVLGRLDEIVPAPLMLQ